MHGRITAITALAIVIFLFASAAAPHAQQPRNLGLLKKEIIRYYDSGQYQRDIARQCRISQTWLKAYHQGSRPCAVVFDIDDTMLSNYPFLKSIDFAQRAEPWIRHFFNADAPAILPVREIFREARKRGFHVFFITGRWERFREATVTNLKKQDIEGYKRMFMLPDGKNVQSMIPFKSSSRRAIEREGYDIILNVGDQSSDLAGGYCRKGIKLPNPIYFTP